jgi:hypothetical protein
MNLPLVDRLGDWNPQLLREIKGRITIRNMAMALVSSIIFQILIVVFNNTAIDKFFWSTWYGFSLLLLGGIFMLITDLDKEEKRGTLNFLRLSPQLPEKIIIGKLLGVPILFYFASLICFYLGAMLLGFLTNSLTGLPPWLAICSAFGFVVITTSKSIYNDPADLLNVLSPILTLKHLIYPHVNYEYNLNWVMNNYQNLEWFDQPIGTSLATTALASILSYATIGYWLFQGLKNRFPSPLTPILTKEQTYLMGGSIELIILGFFCQDTIHYPDHVMGLFAMNIFLFIALIVVLTSSYQPLQDWSRYRHSIGKKRHRLGLLAFLKDLIWGEKSPGLVALMINLLIIGVFLTPFLIVLDRRLILPIIFSINLTLLYASWAQLLLFSKIPKPGNWAILSLGTGIFLPPLILSSLSIYPYKIPSLWFVSTYPLFWSGWNVIQVLSNASIRGILFTVLSQWSAIVLLNLLFVRNLKIVGESSSKALLAEHR